MANLHKFTVQEALNSETAAKWDVQTAVTTSGTTVTHKDVSKYHNVVIDTTKTITVSFDAVSNTTISDTNNLHLPTGIHSLKVPQGIGSTIYLHWRRTGSTNATVRMVLC